jgi:peptide/nickel transport system permease protein
VTVPADRGVVARFAARRGAVAGAAFLLVVALLALVAPVPYPPELQLDIRALRSTPPSLAHPLGTDPYARDVLSRLVHGARLSLGIGLSSAVLATALGVCVGAVAGAAGRRVDAVLMRVVDAGLAVPRALVVLAAVAAWDTLSVPAFVMLLAGTGWFGVSRLVRADVREAARSEWALAARALGVPPFRLWWRHLLPHALAPATVAMTFGVAQAIALEGALSFLGVGVRPPLASWGSMLADAAEHPARLWWIVLAAGGALVATVLAVNAVGDGLRRALGGREVAAS